MAMKEKRVKITVGLPKDLLDAFEKLADRRKISKTDMLRRAIETELFLDEQEQQGNKLLVEDSNNNLMKILRY